MKVSLDETLSFEFDSWALEQAAKAIDVIRSNHRERADSVLRGVLTLLVMASVEQQVPGTITTLIRESQGIADALSRPKAESKGT